MECGIYVIENTLTHKLYVGSSTDIQTRWKSHRSELNRGMHCNAYLQRAWDKYGANVFQFRVIETCPPQVLHEREQHWINEYHAAYRKHGYNLAKQVNHYKAGSERARSERRRYTSNLERENYALVLCLMHMMYILEGKSFKIKQLLIETAPIAEVTSEQIEAAAKVDALFGGLHRE